MIEIDPKTKKLVPSTLPKEDDGDQPKIIDGSISIPASTKLI